MVLGLYCVSFLPRPGQKRHTWDGLRPTSKNSYDVRRVNMWGGRFSGTIDERMARFNNSYPFDCRMWDEDIRGSLAWARQIHAAGVITAAELAELTAGLAAVRAEFAAGNFAALVADEDIHSAVERRLGELAGAVAGKLHT